MHVRVGLTTHPTNVLYRVLTHLQNECEKMLAYIINNNVYK